jgi:putative transposase
LAEKLAVCEHYIFLGYKITKVLKYAGIASSTWYYHKTRIDKKDCRKNNRGRPAPGYSVNPDGTVILDITIIAAIKKYRNNPFFHNGGGYHKLKHYIRKDYNYFVNHKKLYRLCKENNLLLPRRRKQIRQPRKISINRKIYKPNQLWEFDIKYGYIHGLNRFFFILVYIDIYSRKIVNYYVGLTCTSHNLSATLDFALDNAKITGENLVIRSDNGPQMSSNQFREHLYALDIEHEFIPCATPNKNAHVESFFSIVEREFIEVNYFKNFKDVAVKLNKFILFYNSERVHGSLSNKTPEEILEDYSHNGYNANIRNLRA